jgi:hypothetical protein
MTCFIHLSENEFDEQFPLLTNHLNPAAGWAIGDDRGCLFETYGEEFAFVMQQDRRCVWTWIDGDEGDMFVISGLHFVNRIGYLVSEHPIPDGTTIEVHLRSQSDRDFLEL